MRWFFFMACLLAWAVCPPGTQAGDLADGQDLFFARDFQEAKARFGAALDAAPDDPLARYFYGLSCFKLGQFEEARPHLEAAVAAKDDFDLGRLYLARVCNKLHDAACAVQRYGELKQRKYPLLPGDEKDYLALTRQSATFVSALPAPPVRAAGPAPAAQRPALAVPRVDSGKRVALVVGNGDYRVSPLVNTLNDAEDVAEMLRGMGFTVLHGQNLGLRAFNDALETFAKELDGASTGLFYYAGHGMQIKGRNYLIPVKAKIGKEADVPFEALDAGRVLAKMEDASCQANVIILDACRDNPFARGFRNYLQGLAMMDAPIGSILAYATAPGSVASDGYERNGIYTKHLLETMRVPGLTIENILKRVRIKVMQETSGTQVPWEASSLTGDIFFALEH